ncbi:MAG TPA: LD-carboxypeptidase [Casimicrobiaceae bacterium]|nr:LD-carboxypeptidase [Casimicrobiaceae bacterium]
MTDSLSIGLFAPSGVVIDTDALDRAMRTLRDLGHRVVEDDASREKDERFAGDDAARLAAIMRIARADVDVAMAIRGGYGLTRLLDRIDYRALHGKRWIGHSDFTVLQLAALARSGLVTYAGPMAAYDFSPKEPSAFTLEHCFAMLTRHEHEVEIALDGPTSSPLEGTLWGGNLSMLAHVIGTPYLPRIEGGILFLEDISEHPYRVERMLYQLHYAGVLAKQRAILLGAFTDYSLYPHDAGYDLPRVIEHLRNLSALPIYAGLPFGHVRDKLTLPVGGRITLIPGDGRARLVLRDR